MMLVRTVRIVGLFRLFFYFEVWDKMDNEINYNEYIFEIINGLV